MIEQNPLLGSGAVIGVHVSGHPPVVVRKKVHGAVNSLEGGVEIIR